MSNITYRFPTEAEVKAIGPAKVARTQAARLGLQILPVRATNKAWVEWEQKDNYYGLQQLRGLDGQLSRVSRIGKNRYRYEPGYFGEEWNLGETELTLEAGSVESGTIDMTAHAMEFQDQGIQREADVQEYIAWKLLTEGTWTITSKNGTTFSDTFAIQTYNASTWSTGSSATPLLDLRTVASTKGVGKGLSFGAGAKAYCNKITARHLMQNSNSADLGGKYVGGGNTINTMVDINNIFLSNDLPQIVTYDEGYYDDNNTFQYYIPTGTVVVVGARSNGELIGEYLLTRHMINGGGTGSWEFTKDAVNGVGTDVAVPPYWQYARGHNGGPVLYHPGAIVVMDVS